MCLYKNAQVTKYLKMREYVVRKKPLYLLLALCILDAFSCIQSKACHFRFPVTDDNDEKKAYWENDDIKMECSIKPPI